MNKRTLQGEAAARERRKIHILLAERFPVTRYGVRSMLSERPDLLISREVDDGLTALEELRTGRYDVLICGIDLHGLEGIELAKQAKSEGLDTPILVYSRLPEEEYAIRALKAGALGYLSKETGKEELIIAVETVNAGRRYVSAAIVQSIAAQLGSGVGREPHELLSDRELEVMRRIALGRSIKEIASDLNLSVSTVSTYRNRIMTKMNMEKNSDLTRYAMKHDLVD